MTREITIAAIQLPAAPSGKTSEELGESNFKAAEYWLDQAGMKEADIACLGEMFNIIGIALTGDKLHVVLKDALEKIIARLGTIARKYRMIIIAPVAVLIDGIPRNTALILDRHGDLIGVYCKVHCTENERIQGFVPGDQWPTFALDFGRIGIQICHDNSFLESARCLALNGAEIIFWPHTMSGWGDSFMDVLMRSPAVHNGIWHVPVCFGVPSGQAWRPGMLIGHSSIIAPDGISLVDAGRRVGIAMTRIDLDAVRVAHDFTRSGEHLWRDDMLADRRPETYTSIVRPFSSSEQELS